MWPMPPRLLPFAQGIYFVISSLRKAFFFVVETTVLPKPTALHLVNVVLGKGLYEADYFVVDLLARRKSVQLLVDALQ
jgi:hypothetical protein